MRYILTTLAILIFSVLSSGQNTDYLLQLNTGLFYFSGPSAESTETINYNLDKEDGYTNNPYGSRPGLSYGLSGRVSRITAKGFRLGVGLGYEILRSRIKINQVWQYSGVNNEAVVADGKTNINLQFINLFPSLGYRVLMGNYQLDIDGGLDIGYCLQAKEQGRAESEAGIYETERDRKTINLDLRPRVQAGISKNRLGVYLAYSKGLSNYRAGFEGGTNEASSNLLRFGLQYRLQAG